MTLALLLFFAPLREDCTIPIETWPNLNVLGMVFCYDGAMPGECLTANAGDDDTGVITTLITLDGTNTTTPHTPGEIEYLWQQLDNGAPSVTLNNAQTAMPSFTPAESATYVFELTTTWYCRQDSDTVSVEVSGQLIPNSLNAELVVNTLSENTVQVTYASPFDDRLFIVVQDGTIRILDNGTLLPTPFLDITDIVNDNGSEQGLLGMAFDPDYTNNGVFYVNYTGTPPAGGTGANNTRIAAFGTDSLDPNLADRDTNHLLLSITQPFTNHNGGQLLFGPDGYLYIGTGDGGSGGDPGNRAQDPQDLLGKMLRLQTNGIGDYTIPADNPFVGDPTTLDEIWALGLRNPWRYSFDRQEGDLYIGDVGQNAWEEVDFQPANSTGGENYGWRLKEGDHCFNPPSNCDPGGLTDPIFEYPHGPGNICSVTGGFVYRGSDIPLLQGYYIVADYCGSGSGSSTALSYWTLFNDGGIWEANNLEVFVNNSELTENVTGFGEDNTGELYICTASNRVYKITGIRD